ncbi:MAG TPA: hypothetical protein VMT17_01655 [Anaeromyxobacteraceae bacterium]|nr:hypothetical protein [Anaeromyxobacteraceae bacterium]
MSESRPYWYLISVLFSTVPLTESLAMSLYEVARSLHRSGESAGEVLEAGAEGRVKNLHRSFALGSISGPGFEAELDLKEGKGKVRFLLTREGLERGKRRDRLEAVLRN